MTWAVAGGGTGGHVTMALALAEEIRERGGDVFLLGTDQGLERELVPAAGFELVTFEARQVMGQRLLARVGALAGLVATTAEARRALRGRSVTGLLSVGGYASMPAVAAAALSRIPTALVEPNGIPGRANRLMARFARLVFTGFEEANAHLPVPGDRIRLYGCPLRHELVAAFAARESRKPEPPFRLLVAGGSQGARQLNEGMMDVLPSLDPATVEIFHQTGRDDRARVDEAYRKAGFRAEVVDFTGDMPARYGWADLAVCRAGALTVAELALAGLPSLLVPYPFAADDHQTVNARALTDAGGAILLESRPFDPAALANELRALFSAPTRITEMRRALASRARPGAARAIVDDCKEIFGSMTS
ncbi:MAG: undecaprenyldiphospho-muramoylpentapeptide beta-N-acetylglucosaminyltransferase [Deltaproteobacteria bacterium]|nr:undecaprenyldiphospho-muramoylpentapeptide beta-N-acetylglucosaminyltransferase [Deltaproteobacteria bacterium]